MRPEKVFIRFMENTRVHFELRVNEKGEITDRQDVAGKLFFDFWHASRGIKVERILTDKRSDLQVVEVS